MNNPPTPRTTIILLIALMLALAGFGYRQIKKVWKKVEVAESQNSMLSQQLVAHERIAKIDEILLDQNFQDALEQYRGLKIGTFSGSGKIDTFLQQKIKLTTILLELGKVNELNSDSLFTRSPQMTLEEHSPSRPNIRLSTDGQKFQEKVDSLLFALEKSKIEAERLNAQLTRNTSGNYISFQSAKGNTVHYVGEILNGRANGAGVGILSTGSRYEGSWKDNMKHGKGIFYWSDGASYNGEYSNDLRQGEGTYLWPNGEKFVGQWHNDVRNGKGTFYGEDGKVVADGKWANDELVDEK